MVIQIPFYLQNLSIHNHYAYSVLIQLIGSKKIKDVVVD